MKEIKSFKLYLLVLSLFYTCFHPADTFANECIRGNCVNGYGTYLYNSNRKYTGEWKNGKRHGQGTLTYPYASKYIGEWKNDRMNGYGIKIYPDGSKYVGEWKSGNKHGQGIMFYVRGSQYIGKWENGYRQGRGEMIYKKGWEVHRGTKYIGEWKKDKKDGRGIMTMTIPDGVEYIGEWRNNKMHNQGTLNYANVVFKGKWENGLRQQGTLICPDGLIYRGSGWKFARMKFKDLVEWRIRNGYSQEELAEVLKVTNEFISIYEGASDVMVFNYLQIVIECLDREEKAGSSQD